MTQRRHSRPDIFGLFGYVSAYQMCEFTIAASIIHKSKCVGHLPVWILHS